MEFKPIGIILPMITLFDENKKVKVRISPELVKSKSFKNYYFMIKY